MKKGLSTILVGLLLAAAASAFGQGTAFTYQGRLNSAGGPVSGSYDFTFALFDSASGGTQQGSTLTSTATAVSNGLFTVTLDFGNQFPGAARWLEIGVRTNGGGSVLTLSPRQALTATPYAVQAASAANASSVAAGNILGTLTAAQLPGSVITNGSAGVNLTGTFTGNGAGVTNLTLSALSSGGVIDWPGNFTFAGSLTVGMGPTTVVAADVNGDGRLDLISANFSTNTLSVLTNNGEGGFALAASLVVGNNPFCVVAADLNGDGQLDLVSVNAGANSLSVLTNDGRGGFSLAASPVVGSTPIRVVAADVNGDGKLDLVCANYGANSLSVMTNDSRGGFVLASTLSVGVIPAGLVAADVNGDGQPDLISANSSDNTLTILTNDGHGGFIVAATPPVGADPIAVIAVDVNGDARPDLVTANGNDNTLTILTNDGRGGFALASSPAAGNGPRAVAATDVNRDGKLDLVCANANDNTLTILTNNGSGAFATSFTLPVGSTPYSVVAADVSGDGHVDLVSANNGANTLSLWFNTATFSGYYTGDGSGLGALNASALASGTVPGAALAGSYGNALTLTNAGNSFAGNGAGLTNLNVAQLTGTLPDSHLSANVALRAGGNAFTGNQSFSAGNLFLDNPQTIFAKNHFGVYEAFLSARDSNDVTSLYMGNGGLNINTSYAYPALFVTGNALVGINTLTPTNTLEVNGDMSCKGAIYGYGGALSSLNASQLLTGTVPGAVLAGTYPNVLVFNNGANAFAGDGSGLINLNASKLLTGTVPSAALSGIYSNTLSLTNPANTFSGNGGGLTNLLAAQLTGTVPSAALSGVYSNALSLTNLANRFSGNGGGLTNLPAAQITGTLALAQLPAGLVTNGSAGLSLTGTFTGNGAGLTNLNASQLLTGTVADTRLSANVALRNVNNTFSGNQTITAGSLFMDNAQFLLAKNTSGTYDDVFYPRWSDNATYLNYGSGGFYIRNNSSALTMFLQPNGNVGLATTAPGKLLQLGTGNNPADAMVRLACGNGSIGRTWDIGVPYGGNDASGTNYSFIISDPFGNGVRLMIDYVSGAVCIGTTTPVNGSLLTVGTAYCNGTTWQNGSDRNSKEDFAPVDPEAILARVLTLPVQRWTYKSQPGQTHVGPMAQDFHAAFGLNGSDDKHIATVDESGVALAAIQGLNHKLERKENEIAELKAEVIELRNLVKEMGKRKEDSE